MARNETGVLPGEIWPIFREISRSLQRHNASSRRHTESRNRQRFLVIHEIFPLKFGKLQFNHYKNEYLGKVRC
jgi:hypothetical protein